jgi:hypothetical protein
MRCNEFDTHIDEMLSGVLHPEANLHMRQCERCTSHLRSRAAVQNGLRQLASGALPGPSHATDRAVMDGYRRLQQRRAAAGPSAPAAQGSRLLTFPSRGHVPAASSRKWLTHSAAAAVVLLAALGSGVYLWNGATTVSAPSVAGTPAAPQAASADAARHSGVANAVTSAATNVAANLIARPLSQRPGQLSARAAESRLNTSRRNGSEAATLASGNSSARAVGDVNRDSITPEQGNAASVMHLASTGAGSVPGNLGNIPGAAGNAAQAASATWPGYSNLMYCDPVVCSGPMQVVHIKVPVGQVKSNVGQSTGNGSTGNDFVNADVVVGPDGVARAIRVAN